MSSDPRDHDDEVQEPEPDGVPAPAPDPGHEGSTPGPDAAGDPPGPAEPPTPRRRPEILRPVEAIERLDRQWSDRRPIEGRTGELVALLLTTPDDPRGFDYLGLLTGASSREIADACAGWLSAQLAADAITAGDVIRPRVALVPSGGLWFVVRLVADVLVILDGPGLPTPLAATRAAYRRYQVELMRRLEPEPVGDSAAAPPPATDADPSGDAPEPGEAA
jgi:hypothetical protein